jgi:DNA polymerase I-like protein with 3'-5' exonuclease and polymerase domains
MTQDFVRQQMTKFPSLRGASMIAIDTETCDPDLATKGPGPRRDGFIAGISVGTDTGFRAYYPVAHKDDPDNLDPKKVFGWLKQELSRPVPIVGMNLLYDLDYLSTQHDIMPAGPFWDIANAEALIDETRFKYSLDSIADFHLKEHKTDEEMLGYISEHFSTKKPKNFIWQTPSAIVAPYAIGDVDLPLRIWPKQRKMLDRLGMWELFEMESALIPMLLAMRQRGVRVNIPYAKKLYKDLAREQNNKIEQIKHNTGFLLDPWKVTSIVPILDSLGIKYPMTPKTKKASVTAPWLAAQDSDICQLIQEVRHRDKLKETFVQGYLLNGHINGRIHCLFNQLKGEGGGAVSGRFSCVAEWTPVVTSNGLCPIWMLRVGDLVWTHKQRWRRVAALWLKGTEPMLNISLSNGKVLTCTRQHRILLPYGQWITAGELYERFKKVDARSDEHRSGAQLVPNQKTKNPAPDRDRTGNDVSQRRRGVNETSIKNRTQGANGASLLGFENGQQQPDARQGGGTTPQLEGGMLRWVAFSHLPSTILLACQSGKRAHIKHLWLSNNQTEWQEDFCTPPCSTPEVGTDSATPRLRSSPYRHQPAQQLDRQSGACYQSWAQDYSRLAAAGWQGVSITAIDPGGSHEVFDITVEDDESYAAVDVLNHNSSFPNLQNIPQRTKEGNMIRTAFVPEGFGAKDVQLWYKIDWSQIEYRLMVHDATMMNMPGAAEVAKMYNDDATTDFHKIIEDATGFDRTKAKTINFGIAYGEGIKLLAKNLGVSRSEAEAFLVQYHKRAPFMKPLIQHAMNAARSGELRTLMNRRRCFNTWERREDDWTQTITYIKKDPNRFKGRIPGAQRAFTYAGLNARIQGSAADIMKKAMVKIWQSGVIAVLGAPHLVVHDEFDFSAPNSKAGFEAIQEVKYIMEHCVDLKVPVRADVSYGPNWGDQTKIKDSEYETPTGKKVIGKK